MPASCTRFRSPISTTTSPMWFPNIIKLNFIINRMMIFIINITHFCSTSITTKVPSSRMASATFIIIICFFIYFFASDIKAYSIHFFFSFFFIFSSFVYFFYIRIFFYLFEISTSFYLISNSW